jgi:hypothetical protein
MDLSTIGPSHRSINYRMHVGDITKRRRRRCVYPSFAGTNDTA